MFDQKFLFLWTCEVAALDNVSTCVRLNLILHQKSFSLTGGTKEPESCPWCDDLFVEGVGVSQSNDLSYGYEDYSNNYRQQHQYRGQGPGQLFVVRSVFPAPVPECFELLTGQN